MWKNASTESPKHEPDHWSDEMICLTNLGNVYKLTFMGVWQRLAAFKPGEEVDWWIENPYADPPNDEATRLRADILGIIMMYGDNMHPRIKQALKSVLQDERPVGEHFASQTSRSPAHMSICPECFGADGDHSENCSLKPFISTKRF